MVHGISHRREDEGIEGKLEMTLSLTPEQRYFEMLDLLDLYAGANPRILDYDDPHPSLARGPVQVLELPRR